MATALRDCGPGAARSAGRCRSRRARRAARSRSPPTPRARSHADAGRTTSGASRSTVTWPRRVSWYCRTSSSPGLGRRAPVHVPQVVAGDVLPQRVERQVAHRQLLARRPVEVVGESPGEDAPASVTRGDDEELERPPPTLEPATHQADRIGLLVGHGSDGVHSTRHLGKRRPPPSCRAKGARNGRRSRTLRRAHGDHDAREQHRGRARLDLEQRAGGAAAHDRPAAAAARASPTARRAAPATAAPRAAARTRQRRAG